ncbi:MAG: hypothetical protein K2X91_04810, partial [Thermoleophilia bacterium]|nr:hypothetical protein [Thermoleophilia bacterium]
AGLVYRAMGNLKRDIAGVTTSLALQGHRMIAARRVLLADLALRLHRLRRGSDPERLDELVPAILESVPIDPFTGRPLIYRRTASGHELYSAGPDGDDDRLNPTLPTRLLPSSNGDFTIDSF